MKTTYQLLLCILFITSYSCTKEANITSDVLAAETRLGNQDYWEISDASLNGVFFVKDKVVIDSTDFEPSEYFKFDTSAKTIEVKSYSDPNPTFYKYTIVGDNFTVFQEDNSEDVELMTIKSGSVFDDHFTLEQTIESDVYVVKFVAKK
jgi:hypothetical protein